MPYTLPTADQLQAAFPAFSAVPDPTVDFWIERAARMVDTSWMEDDYQFGIMLLAAHEMVGIGLGTGAQAQANANGMSAYQTIRSGLLTLSRGATSQSDGVPSPWNTSPYGVAWYWLAKRNRPAVAVAVGPTALGDIPSPYAYPGSPWGWPWH